MKELLSIEEKAKRYDEALDNAKVVYKTIRKDLKPVIEQIFPELVESEDERVRKELIDHIRHSAHNTPADKFNGWIAWLKKQGEQKYIDHDTLIQQRVDALANIVAEQKPAGKVEPKFKVGDFIVNDYCMGKVIELTNDAYLLDTGQGIPFSCEHNAHLWTIQDAKDGDVLVDSYSKDSIIILYKGIYKERSILAHCGWNGYNLSIKTNGLGYGRLDNTNYSPATKEQRNFLFQKIKEAGYEWDAEKKEPKKIEQNSIEPDDFIEESYQQQADDLIDMVTEKPAWSEEDESILQGIWDEILANKHDAKECEWKTYDKFLNWLKSLRPQNTWKPSDEQMKALSNINLTGNISYSGQGQELINLYNDLKELKG